MTMQIYSTTQKPDKVLCQIRFFFFFFRKVQLGSIKRCNYTQSWCSIHNWSLGYSGSHVAYEDAVSIFDFIQSKKLVTRA